MPFMMRIMRRSGPGLTWTPCISSYNTIQYNTIQYNTIELYCPVNGKFVYSVRVKVNKN